MVALGLTILILLAVVVSSVVGLIMLIKQFKHGGALHGVIHRRQIFIGIPLVGSEEELFLAAKSVVETASLETGFARQV